MLYFKILIFCTTLYLANDSFFRACSYRRNFLMFKIQKEVLSFIQDQIFPSISNLTASPTDNNNPGLLL